jgi:O-acetylserine/cysteine efflux transporter
MPLLGLPADARRRLDVGDGQHRHAGRRRHGPINQLAFVVWASLVPPLPFLALSLLIEGWPAIDVRSAPSACAPSPQWPTSPGRRRCSATACGRACSARYPVNQVAPFSLLVPLVGLTTGWLAFGEALRPVHFAGAALLMLGLVINLFGARLLRG